MTISELADWIIIVVAFLYTALNVVPRLLYCIENKVGYFWAWLIATLSIVGMIVSIILYLLEIHISKDGIFYALFGVATTILVTAISKKYAARKAKQSPTPEK